MQSGLNRAVTWLLLGQRRTSPTVNGVVVHYSFMAPMPPRPMGVLQRAATLLDDEPKLILEVEHLGAQWHWRHEGPPECCRMM